MDSGVKYKAFRAWRQGEIPGKNVQRERGGDLEQALDMPSVRVRRRRRSWEGASETRREPQKTWGPAGRGRQRFSRKERPTVKVTERLG